MKSFSNDSHSSITPVKTSGKTSGKNSLRQKIAVEAARLMSEEGIDNIHSARKKAAHHLNINLSINNQSSLPDNDEILFQLKTHQSLYQSSDIELIQTGFRKTALNAMKLFHRFKPKLIGSVLQGYAQEHSSIDLLVNADSPEEVAVLLMTHNIPYQLKEWTLYFGKPGSRVKDNIKSTPSYQFYADTQAINLIVLSENLRKITLLEPGTWKAMPKASLVQVEKMLE